MKIGGLKRIYSYVKLKVVLAREAIEKKVVKLS